MSITAMALAHLLQTCAPNIGPKTMTAIVSVESGGNAYAVRDNTIDRAFYPKSSDEAVRLANYLLARRHNLDLGISQVNSANLPGLGMSVREAFNPCTNMKSGASILAGDYRRAVEKFGPGQYALRRAIGAYNTGSLFAGDKYISMILAAAGINDSVADTVHVPNLESESQARSQRQAPVMRQAAPVETEAHAPIIASGMMTPVRPEDSPILVHAQGLGSLASSNVNATARMTHIPVDRSGSTLTHIPLTPVQLPPAGQEAVNPEDAPIVEQQPSMLQGTAQVPPQELTPQQIIQEAGRHRRRR